MDTSRVFKFATIRNATDKVQLLPDNVIKCDGILIAALIAINASSAANSLKLTRFNNKLKTFVNSDKFIKSRAEFAASLSHSGSLAYRQVLSDNIVARVLSRSTNNSIYKLLVEQLKNEHEYLNAAAIPPLDRNKFRIILPEGLNYSFIEAAIPPQVSNSSPAGHNAQLAAAYQNLVNISNLLVEAEEIGVQSFEPSGNVVIENKVNKAINQALGTKEVSVTDAIDQVEQMKVKVAELGSAEESLPRMAKHIVALERLISGAKLPGVTKFEELHTQNLPKFNRVLQTLKKPSVTLAEAKTSVATSLREASSTLLRNVPMITFTQVGESWSKVSDLEKPTSALAGIPDAIYVWNDGCYLKFPFQVADLRVIEKQTVGYLPAEIAHINNTQPGALNTRVTRRLTRTESFESMIVEDEVVRETDSQSTEKFSVEREAAQVQQEESSINVNASVSATYGPVSASLDAGYENSTSTTNSNSAAQAYAKEIVQRIVDRVSKKVRSERSTKTIEEFEETVTHVIDNSKEDGPKSYVYRWLTKLVRAKLKNYGKRLIFQLDVAHPSHYHISREMKSGTTISLPEDPRTFSIGEVVFSDPSKITPENYLALADHYGAKIDAPPPETIIISRSFGHDKKTRESKDIDLPKGYGALRGKWNGVGWNDNVVITIAASAVAFNYWEKINPDDSMFCLGWSGRPVQEFSFNTYPGGLLITEKVSITFWVDSGSTINFEIECKRMPETLLAWQVKAFQQILDAYDVRKQEAEAKMSEFNPNLPGLNPDRKLQLIRSELKKEAIRRMLRCKPLGVSDAFVVGTEYQSNCCEDSDNAAKAKFLESVFDWQNMTYEFYPYFYGSREVRDSSGTLVSDNWNEIQKFTDSDPHFEAFLQASYATINLPVHRDANKETAALNFILNNSIANHEVIPEGLLSIVEELELEPATNFTYDLDGKPIAVPTSTIDLGIFNLPTDLVILECGTADGVKPRPFPESTDEPSSDVIIPKQYSPAIIAESCQ